jgi:hypothetical protein
MKKKSTKRSVDVERRKIRDELERISFSECEGSLKDLIARLYECLEKHEHAPCTNISVEFDTAFEQYGGGSQNNEIVITGLREETDTEFARRIETEAELLKKQEQHEKSLYEQLKGKFEKT